MYGDAKDLRRSSAVTTGDSLARLPPAVTPAAPAVTQGSKSYIDVSMSANNTSSSAKSERNPEGEEEEEGEEGEEEMSTKPAGAGDRAVRVSIGRSSMLRLSASKTPAASGFAPEALQSLVGPGVIGGSGVGAGEVVTVVELAAAVLVMAVGGPNSMSLRAEGKPLLDETGTGTRGGAGFRSAKGKCGA